MVNKKELKLAVEQAKSYRGVCRNLDIDYTPKIKKWIEEYGISTDHFTSDYRTLVGQKFNHLVIQKVFKDGRTVAECLCDCGNVVVKRCDSVVHGKVKTCGCRLGFAEKISGKNNPAFLGVGDIRKGYFTEIKKGAKRRNLDFDLTIDYIWSLFQEQDCKCALSGIELTFGPIHTHDRNASLDRIDSNLGYVEGNVQWVHKDVNFAKGSMSQTDFVTMCKMVSNYSTNL